MPTFSAPDGTMLAYHESGEDAPLICLPGGPMQDPAYLGDLGGLSTFRRLVMPHLRGTGESAIPEDAGSYRCDRQVEDVEALRVHLGLDRIDLLGHSAGTNLALRYVERHPDRVTRLALITPSTAAVGITITPEVRKETAQLRGDESWFPEAYAALEAITAGNASADSWPAIAPFWYARWDDAARTHHAAEDKQRNSEAAAAFAAEGAFDPAATRTALAAYDRPVLVLAGAYDLNSPMPAMTELAALFPNAKLVVQPGASHFPWLDNPARFTAATTLFLT